MLVGRHRFCGSGRQAEEFKCIIIKYRPFGYLPAMKDFVIGTFLPYAGQEYARLRNFDEGPGHVHVSTLSPWIRHRLLLESEVVSTVLKRHRFKAAEVYPRGILAHLLEGLARTSSWCLAPLSIRS